MKQIISFFIIASVALSLTSTPAHAQTSGRDFGLGFILGSPTALSGKLFLSGERAIDVGLAFSSDDYILVFGDYLLHYPGFIKTELPFLNGLVPYFGVGPLLAFETDDHRGRRQYFEDHDDGFAAGIRVPFGVEWMAREIPLGISLELAPGIVVIPGTDGFVNAGLALRYYFK